MKYLSSPMPSSVSALSGQQRFVIAVLAFLQFTVVLDFVVLSPLGALLMPALRITPRQFGVAVSVYAFSAAASGLLAAGFADRFDRKRFLLVFYGGFLVGTALCGIARSYELLLVARGVTGMFGGVLGSSRAWRPTISALTSAKRSSRASAFSAATAPAPFRSSRCTSVAKRVGAVGEMGGHGGGQECFPT